MAEIAYVNGKFVPLEEAVVSVEDRGFVFADGVYEVLATRGGRPYAVEGHMQRLERSLREIEIGVDVGEDGIDLVRLMEEGLERSGFAETLIYIQITRGTAPRRHPFPDPAPAPTVVLTFRELEPLSEERFAAGGRAITAPDMRWRRCDIKSVALLPNILAREAARRAGVDEALLVDEEGQITEGSTTSAFCVVDGELRTRPLGSEILPSISRGMILELAGELGIPVKEVYSTREEYLAADEVFIAGTTLEGMPIVEVDGQAIGDGRAGPVALRLRQAFLQSLPDIS